MQQPAPVDPITLSPSKADWLPEGILTLREWDAFSRSVLRSLLSQVTTEGYSVEFKSSSKMMRALGVVYGLLPGNHSNSFTHDFTTVWGRHIYLAERNRTAWEASTTLAHELVHIHDKRDRTFFNFRYACPQILAPLALFALGAFWSPWFLLFLLFLVFLYPFKALSSFRHRSEVRAYTMNLFMHALKGDVQGSPPDPRDLESWARFYATSMSSSRYLWMTEYSRAYNQMQLWARHVSAGAFASPLRTYSCVQAAIHGAQEELRMSRAQETLRSDGSEAEH